MTAERMTRRGQNLADWRQLKVFFLDEVTMVSGTTVGFHLGLQGVDELEPGFALGSGLGDEGTVIFGPEDEEWVVPYGFGDPRPVVSAGQYDFGELPSDLTLTFGNLTPSSLYSVVFWSGDQDLEEAVDELSVYCIPADGAGELAIPFEVPGGGTLSPFAALQISECGCTAPSIIPEPGSLALAFLGLTLLGFRRTRR